MYFVLYSVYSVLCTVGKCRVVKAASIVSYGYNRVIYPAVRMVTIVLSEMVHVFTDVLSLMVYMATSVLSPGVRKVAIVMCQMGT